MLIYKKLTVLACKSLLFIEFDIIVRMVGGGFVEGGVRRRALAGQVPGVGLEAADQEGQRSPRVSVRDEPCLRQRDQGPARQAQVHLQV